MLETNTSVYMCMEVKGCHNGAVNDTGILGFQRRGIQSGARDEA